MSWLLSGVKPGESYMKQNYLPWVLGALLILVGGYYVYATYGQKSPEMMDKKVAPEAVMPKVMTVTLGTQGTFGQSGVATFTENAEGKAVVTLAMTGGSFAAPQPAHIHVGACPKPGAVKYPLTNVENGASVTTLSVSLDELKASTESLALNVHKSAAESSIYTACGDLPINETTEGAGVGY